MRISSLTFEKIIELETIIDNASKEIELLESTKIIDLWQDDIKKFQLFLKKGD